MASKKDWVEGRLGYNVENDCYELLISDLWEHEGFHCGEGLQVLVDDKWVQTCFEKAWEKDGNQKKNPRHSLPGAVCSFFFRTVSLPLCRCPLFLPSSDSFSSS